MMGAILGDIVGSRWSWTTKKEKNFPIFTTRCQITDDTVLTLAVADALLSGECDARLADTVVASLRTFAARYPRVHYGRMFCRWLLSETPAPYGSFGNGAASRVSACAYVATTLEEAKTLSQIVTAVTHNHPAGLRGAEATTVAIWMASHGATKDEIRATMSAHYYQLSPTLDAIRPTYRYDSTCQGTVPAAILCFLDAESTDDAIRNAVSLGGDSDTLAAITGSLAEAYFGVPEAMRQAGNHFLPAGLQAVVDRFEAAFPQSKRVAADGARRV